jgi:uncharacterized protein YndB with AHSA1/START domain
MEEIEITIAIRRPAQEVFDYLTDIDRATDWNPAASEVRKSPRGAAQGRKYAGACSKVPGTPI